MTSVAWSLWLLSTFVCSYSATSDEGEGALLLTPLIRNGRIDEARAACNVTSLEPTIESYSGYLTVDETYGSNMFFWFFPAANGNADAPVLLWLQGGPGASSMFGVFNLHGPFSVQYQCDDVKLKLRDHAWTTTHSVLYVDNPVGTGFSYTADDSGYSTDQTAVARNLYAALVQFFELFPEYRNNDFYVTGESFAGHYVPAISYTIHQNNLGAKVKINLKGLAIGNGLVDPINQLFFGEYLHQHGLIDENGKRKFEQFENAVRAQILADDYKGAFRIYDEMLNGIFYQYPTLFQNLTGMHYYYNMLLDQKPPSLDDWMKFVENPSVKAALHVGSRPLNNNLVVYQHLLGNVLQSVAPWLGSLLDAGRYRVLLYSGQLDIKLHHRGNMRMAQSLEWTGAERFRNTTERTVWRVREQKNGCEGGNKTTVAGYATTSGPLTVLLVRDAGHMVPADQPVWALDLIDRFTAGKTF
ncbi:venom serine carboxypeptidase-like [Rhopalosiphum maidis]|uniref:venom serine carboxypeptidase-like n=1 Tax=Rhopalosiphum maidis TaxID=43146 RepID=UPI000F008CC1|nr:venom serine carboxypeptidase-like [Rhopalosiphum maidis]XP_026822660.1 venom serine carboxypeptidase-like [Rhopalosiphum maidis]